MTDPAAFDRTMQEAVQCAQAARAQLDAIASTELMQSPFFFKPEACIVSVYLTWGKMDEAEAVQERLITRLAAAGGSKARLAFQTDEFADICLDGGRIDKAERLFLDALRLWELYPIAPGVAGEALVHKAKSDLAHKIYFQQVSLTVTAAVRCVHD